MIIVKVQVEVAFSDLDLYTASLTETVVGEDKEKCIEHAYMEIQNKAYVFTVDSKEATIETYKAKLEDGVYRAGEKIDLEVRAINFC